MYYLFKSSQQRYKVGKILYNFEDAKSEAQRG